MNKIFRNILWIFSVSLLLGSCIPIEDRLSPFATAFNLEDVYYLQDSVDFAFTVTDNDGLQKAVFEIQEYNPIGTPTWVVLDSMLIQGRRYIFDYYKIVPINARPGFYDVRVSIYDLSGNISILTDRIEVRGDIRGPYSSDVAIQNLELRADGVYEGCRLEPIILSGTLKDNIGLDRIEARLESYPSISINLNGIDSVLFSDIFGYDLKIPNTVEDGTLLTLKITAWDTDGNQSIFTFEIYVDCDDQAPIIQVITSNPSIENSTNISVVQGGKFTLSDVVVSDNRYVQNFYLLFGLSTQEPDTLYNLEVNEENTPMHLNEVFGTFTVNIPFEATPGERYQVILLANDSSGLFSDPLPISILVSRDEPPLILVSNTYINEVATDWSISPLNTVVHRGDLLRFEGKIEEDIAFELIKIDFGLTVSSNIITLSADELVDDLPFNLADVRSENEFRIPDTANIGEVYLLRISATDIRGQAVSKTYRFIVQ